MAEQTITIPASTLFNDTDSQKRYDTNDADSIELNRDLYTYITDMSITRWTRRFIAETDPDGFEFRMILGRSGTWPTGQMGDDLDPEWETNGSALAFAQGAFSVTGVPGPDHPDNFLQDSGETYRWIVAGDVATALTQFFFTDLDTSADLEVTFRTPSAVAPEEVAFDATLVAPSFALALTALAPVTPVVPEAVAMAMETLAPTFSMDLTALAPVSALPIR